MNFTTYGYMDFHTKLRDLMRLKRISQEELGKAVGVSQAQISKWVRGTNRPDTTQAWAIAKELNVSLDYLANPERDESPEQAVAEQEPLGMLRTLGPELARLRLMKAPDSEMEEIDIKAADSTPRPSDRPPLPRRRDG